LFLKQAISISFIYLIREKDNNSVFKKYYSIEDIKIIIVSSNLANKILMRRNL